MKIAVAGAGYVGVANAIFFAQQCKVVAFDKDSQKIDNLNLRKSPVFDQSIQNFLDTKKIDLSGTKNPGEAYLDADVIIIATPTDFDGDTNELNTSEIEKVIEDAETAKSKAAFVIRSTVPIGYTDALRKKYGNKHIYFIPEFLREGMALEDSLRPARVVVGGADSHIDSFLQTMRACHSAPGVPILRTTNAEAEAIKLFANTYLAMRVAFFNEIDSYAASNELNPRNIIQGICLDPRIGSHYNNPSFGFGGYCLTKDTKQLLSSIENAPSELVKATIHSNIARKDFLAQRIASKGADVIGVYRLTPKKNSGNTRSSSAADLIGMLREKHSNIIIYEPLISSGDFQNCKIINDLASFKKLSSIIVANRITEELMDCSEKIFSRDIFSSDT